ncbi:5-hydroxytryptamine receptor 7-like [Anneissia japonica]|uniref:5-hydroxytryptamine receptor 7-like n=1 Tax=Anneissia japonica TaxID=1529436 RepID=UPI001425913F|nr:5-hydroxytryptamine receptor 7-like [Anneissia japonica]
MEEYLGGTFNMDYSSDCNSSTPSGPTEMVIYNSTFNAVVIIMTLTLLIVCTIVGNCLVILSVFLERKLRSPSNYLYVNLAVSDMAVAILVMPMALVTEVTGEWLLGDTICDLWIFLDILCCTASIVNLCMISVDRYLVITRPLQYFKRRTSKFMAVVVACVWALATVITLPPLFGWGRNVHEDNNCLVSQDLGYTIYSTLGAFYGPLAIMLVVYFKIHKAATAAATVQKRRLTSVNQNSQDEKTIRAHLEVPNVNENNLLRKNSGGLDQIKRRRSSLSAHYFWRRNSMLLRASSRRERKATQTLGIIMGAFILCWLPFFIVTLVRPYCGCIIPRSIESIFLWFGYVNSCLNPIIYPMFNRDYRKPYKRILSCRCSEMSYYKYMCDRRSSQATVKLSSNGSKQYLDRKGSDISV